MIKARFLIAFVIVTLCFSNCAKRGYITGGEIDTLPPVLLSSNPKNLSINFDKKEFKLYFDEYVKLKNINQNLIVSPPMDEMPDITPMGNASKVVTIKIKDTLRPNTTYSFNFGESIADNNEGNVFPQLKYIFSTGEYIDSLKVSGTIHSIHQRKTDNFVNVMLYDATTFTDSTVYKEKPLYVTNTLDSLTSFTIENIKEGSYKIIALKDKNNNYKFDPAQDKIAFLEQTITVPTEENLALNLFKSEEKFKAHRPSQVSENKWFLPYNGNTDSIKVSIFNNEERLSSLVTKLSGKDSLQVWLPKIETDSLYFDVQNREFSERFTVRPRVKMKTVDTLSISAKQTNVLELRDQFVLIAKTPVSKIDSSKILFTDKDSTTIPFTFINEVQEQSILFDFEKKESENYKMELLPGAITDFFGQENDSLLFRFKTKEKTDYGNLTVKLQNVKRFPFILEILDSKENVVAQHYSENETSIPFLLLPPRIYLLRLIYDDNKNRKWDSGYYFDQIQPEEVIYYPEELDVRANWDIEQIFDL